MSEKLLPCAFCQADPASFKDEEIAYYFCGNKMCFVDYFSKPFLRNDWINFMTFVMKQRRRDFEAGVRQGVYGLPSYSQDTFLGAFDDLTCSELRDKIFNNYLRRSKGNE